MLKQTAAATGSAVKRVKLQLYHNKKGGTVARASFCRRNVVNMESEV